MTTAFSARIAPSTATIRRVLNAVCPGGLADLLGADPAGALTLAVDGKSARGSRTATSPAAHLLAAMTGTGQTVSQLRVPDKTNEITCFAALLEPYDLAGVTVTADALHTQRKHARFIVEDKKAHYLLLVKANQPETFRQLRSLPWTQATARRYDREKGHGRKETRTTRALTVTDLELDFLHAVQAAKILRHRTDLCSGKGTRQTVCPLTDLTARQASPQRIGQLARSQRVIENRRLPLVDREAAEGGQRHVLVRRSRHRRPGPRPHRRQAPQPAPQASRARGRRERAQRSGVIVLGLTGSARSEVRVPHLTLRPTRPFPRRDDARAGTTRFRDRARAPTQTPSPTRSTPTARNSLASH